MNKSPSLFLFICFIFRQILKYLNKHSNFSIAFTTDIVLIKFIFLNMQEEKIHTLHPEGKKGVNILKRRYDVIKDFIMNTIQKHDEITFEEVGDKAVAELTDSFDGKVLWYVVTVKLDLEARNIIERIPKTSPHKLRIKK